MENAYLLLGSNMGDRKAYLQQSIAMLSRVGRVMRLSSLYESEPWGFDHSTGWFLNQAVELATGTDAPELLHALHEIEQTLGRLRTNGTYRARTIDIDIILLGNRIIRTPELTIPHSLMEQRMFVLQPLSELIPDAVHPILRLTIAQLAAQCTDTALVQRYANE
ncbi:MAG: 2-amino-4-hydroxy-6-hydroxymethyldihydropteridine diphosphokinase [Bacteroidales bacterium]|jgi:2-amino-4-hydroxy-6-hydroxymethyldihydropteridine diphosphokinase|nr:2-amino-4-hydroxy-6-hydroxymethyldihydropteridine diphosphokinase [Bacteroidales bacterium]